MFAQRRAAFSAGGSPTSFQRVAKTNRCPRPGLDKGLELFGNNRAGTVNPVTEERPHMQDQLHAKARAGQIGYHASRVTLATESGTVTAWTPGSLFCGCHMNLQQVINGFDADSLSAWWQGKKGR